MEKLKICYKKAIWCLLLLAVSLSSYADVCKDDFILVIDAGHGGRDYGAIGRIANEKTINLNVALAFGRLVEANCPGVKVVYTRKTDTFVTLQRRADIANNAHADLFVSIHTNALPKGKIAYGTETFTLGMARADENLEVAKRENAVITLEDNYETTYQGFDPNQPESYIIFELMQDKHMEQSVEVARAFQEQYTHYAGRRNKGVKQAGFLVLRATSMPSVLTELGFISTPEEERFLNSKEGVNKMARSLYRGFVNYRRGVKTAEVAEEAPVAQPKAPLEKSAETTPASPPAKPRGNAPADLRPVFKVQFLTANMVLSPGHKQFKGLTPVEHYSEGGMVKYTYGSTHDYNKIKQIKKQVAEKFPQAFVVAFVDGEKVNLQEAIAQSKKK